MISRQRLKLGSGAALTKYQPIVSDKEEKEKLVFLCVLQKFEYDVHELYRNILSCMTVCFVQ